MRYLVPLIVALAFAPTASASLPNPCALLTNAQVAKVLGGKVAMTTPSGNGRFRSCTWEGADMASPSSYAVRRSLMVQLTATTEAAFEKGAEQTPGAIRIAGIGEMAYTDNGVLKPVDVLKHGYALFIVAGNVDDPVATEKAAAKLAVARLR